MRMCNCHPLLGVLSTETSFYESTEWSNIRLFLPFRAGEISSPCPGQIRAPIEFTISKSDMKQPGKDAIDVHSHIYLPGYLDLLRRRDRIPRIVTRLGEERILLLPGEESEASNTQAGRPFGSEFWDPERKLAFMDVHGIATTILSLPNPWLDFLEPAEAISRAFQFNEELEDWCARSGGRFYGFGVLPTPDLDGCLEELERVASLDHLRGVILSTGGLEAALDHPKLDPLWATAERLGLIIFLHPHYAVGLEHFQNTGHSLLLALGFPFETTIAVARMILAGKLEQFPRLKILVAHAGAVLPFLAGRLDAAVGSDPLVHLPHSPSAYLKRLYADAIAYHRPGLQCALGVFGESRVLFGSDHPFFPPPMHGPAMDSQPWPSTQKNFAAIDSLSSDLQSAIYRGNALRFLELPDTGSRPQTATGGEG